MAFRYSWVLFLLALQVMLLLIWKLKEKYNEALEMKNAEETKPKNISQKPLQSRIRIHQKPR